MSVAPTSFFAAVSLDGARKLLEHLDIAIELADVPNEGKRQRGKRIAGEVEKMKGEDSEKVFATMDQIEQLRSATGFRSLQSVIRHAGISLDEFSRFEDVREAAIYVLSRDVRSFDRALASCFADRRQGGRSWSNYNVETLTDHAQIDAPEIRAKIEEQIKATFSNDPMNGRCRVEWFKRDVTDPMTGEISTILQAAIYQELAPQIEPLIEENGPVQSWTRRPVSEGAILFDQSQNEIAVIAAGGKSVHSELAKGFGEILLGKPDGLTRVQPQSLELSSLAKPRQFEIKAEDRVESVSVEMLEVFGHGSDPVISTFRFKPNAKTRTNVYQQIEAQFGNQSPLTKPGNKIVAARLRIVFAPKTESTRAKAVPVDLRLPNKTGLRDQTEEHQLIGSKLLKRWGLLADG